MPSFQASGVQIVVCCSCGCCSCDDSGDCNEKIFLIMLECWVGRGFRVLRSRRQQAWSSRRSRGSRSAWISWKMSCKWAVGWWNWDRRLETWRFSVDQLTFWLARRAGAMRLELQSSPARTRGLWKSCDACPRTRHRHESSARCCWNDRKR